MSLADLAHLTPQQQADLAYYGANQGQSDPNQIGGRPQVWKVGGRYFVAYHLPGTRVPVVWEATEQELKDKYGGAGSPMPTIDRQMSEQDFATLAPWNAGRISEIRNTADDPWSQFYADYRESAELRPWMNDPDMLSTIAVAYLEGREPTADELSQTDWWQTHTAAERKWMEQSTTAGGDELRRQAEDAYRQARSMLTEAGATNVPEHVVRWMSGQFLTGRWGEQYFQEQIRKLADPYAPGELNPGITQRLRDADQDQNNRTRKGEDEVRALYAEWLGPTMGNADQATIERWAGKIRNDPDAMFELQQHLRLQRRALFPKYENENLSYEDIVSPFRNLASNVWGRPMTDEAMLVDLVNTGDFTEAQKRLRKAGLDQGVQKVVNDALSELGSTALGDRVARSTI